MKKLILKRDTIRTLTLAEAQTVVGGARKPANRGEPPRVSANTSCDTVEQNSCVPSDPSYCASC